jgi:hypothetical protein
VFSPFEISKFSTIFKKKQNLFHFFITNSPQKFVITGKIVTKFCSKKNSKNNQTALLELFSLFFERSGVPLGRTSSEKSFLNPIGFRKFFECFPNQHAKDFVGGGVNSAVNLHEI